jgi:hypothetical protein
VERAGLKTGAYKTQGRCPPQKAAATQGERGAGRPAEPLKNTEGVSRKLLARLWILCTFVYWCFLRYSKHGGLYLVPSRQGGGTVLPHPGLQRIKPQARRVRNVRHRHGVIARVKSLIGRNSFRRVKRWCPLFRAAVWFSTASAFNIGFRDVAAGRWLRLLTGREYEIRARGFLRVVSGLQSLLSVGLLALWVLTYFGRPFEYAQGRETQP